MHPARALLALLPFALASGCVVPTGPVEVTRFHIADTAQLGSGSIVIEPAPGLDATSLEVRSFTVATERELQRVGYRVNAASLSDQIAVLRLDRRRYRPERARGPVSVGVGGSTGSYGSGMGVGIGIDLSGAPPEQVETELAVTIRDRRSGTVLWEGRAAHAVSAKSPLADNQLAAAKIATALFRDFPGASGQTVSVP